MINTTESKYNLICVVQDTAEVLGSDCENSSSVWKELIFLQLVRFGAQSSARYVSSK